MSIAKVIEVIAEGKTIEQAMNSALREASRTLKGIQQIDVNHIYAKVDKNKVVKYRIDANVSFLVKNLNKTTTGTKKAMKGAPKKTASKSLLKKLVSKSLRRR